MAIDSKYRDIKVFYYVGAVPKSKEADDIFSTLFPHYCSASTSGVEKKLITAEEAIEFITALKVEGKKLSLEMHDPAGPRWIDNIIKKPDWRILLLMDRVSRLELQLAYDLLGERSKDEAEYFEKLIKKIDEERGLTDWLGDTSQRMGIDGSSDTVFKIKI
jgi:hypothetical protein